MKQDIYTITENKRLAEGIYRMKLHGDISEITAPGQFINIRLEGRYLRRPISVCNVEPDDANTGGIGTVTIIYKVLGKGTAAMTELKAAGSEEAPAGDRLDILTGLGNGYDVAPSGNRPVLIGGGVGIPPLYLLARKLISEGKQVTAVLGFNRKSEMYYVDEFKSLGCNVIVTTADGSEGIRGFVTDGIRDLDYTYFYTCGPEAMLKAVYAATKTSGQLSFEKRMGCGFGACMGCSCKTVTGNKRICKEGPVLMKEEILWQ